MFFPIVWDRGQRYDRGRSLRQPPAHPRDPGDQPGKGEGQQKIDPGKHRHGEGCPKGQGRHSEPPEHQDPELVDQIDAEYTLPQGAHCAAAGALLADPQNIAEQDAQRHRGTGHAGRGVAVPQLPPAADEPGTGQCEDHPKDPQKIDQKLRDAPDHIVVQVPARQVVAHPSQHSVDLKAVQQDHQGMVGVEGGPQRQQAGRQKREPQQVQRLAPAGGGGEPGQQRLDEVQAHQRVQRPEMKIGVSPGGGQQGGAEPAPAQRAVPQQMGRRRVHRSPEHQHTEGGQGPPQQSAGQPAPAAPLQGGHPPQKEQGGHGPAGQPLIDGEDLPRPAGWGDQLLSALGQEQHQGRKNGKDPEKPGPAAAVSAGHQSFTGTISIQ